MYRRQKINLASRITSRSMMVLHQFFNQEQFIAFRRAESEGQTARHLQEERVDLPEETREKILQYLSLINRLSAIEIELQKELLLNDAFDHESWSYAQDKGIVEEYTFIKKSFEETHADNAGKILQLFEQSIYLLGKECDLVLSLDPNLKLLANFDELPPERKSTAALLEEDNSMILGRQVLQWLAPDMNGRILALDEQVKPQLAQFLMNDIVSFLPLDDTLSRKDLQRMQQDFMYFVQYALQQEDELQYPALLALQFEQMPAEYRKTTEFLVLLWQIGAQYQKTYLLNDLDYSALLNLYQFITDAWPFFQPKSAASDTPPDIAEIELHALRQLAECYTYFWEWEEALNVYKHRAQLAQKNGSQKDLEWSIFSAIESLKICSQYELAIHYLVAAIEGSRGKWGLAQPLRLSDASLKTFSIELVMLLQKSTLTESEKQQILQSIDHPTLQSITQFFNLFEEDDLSSEQLLALQQLMSDKNSLIAGFFGKEMSAEESAESSLTALSGYEPEVQVYEQKLAEARRHLEELPEDLRMLYRLHEAKLAFLKGDINCLGKYEKLLPRLSQYPKRFSLSGIGHWYSEYIRASSLVISSKSEEVYPHITNAARQALQFHLRAYVSDYKERHAWQMMISEWENIYKAILINLEACATPAQKQPLIRLLWNILTFHQQTFHLYRGAEVEYVIDEQGWKDEHHELRKSLWAYYTTQSPAAKTQATKTLARRQQYFTQQVRKKEPLKQLEDPPENSILYYFFTRLDGGRRVLMLSYRNEGHYDRTLQYVCEEIGRAHV